MSYFVKKEFVDSTFILRYDMSTGKYITAVQRKTFLDMNKLIALITFDMEELFEINP